MARSIAQISGVALRPGVSLNGRYYAPDVVAAAVETAQRQIGSGDPLTMLVCHGSGDKSTEIVGALTAITIGEGGEALYTADLADTPHAHTILNLIDTEGGRPAFLEGVSIRGYWQGPVRREVIDGQSCDVADTLILQGLDFTATPGVPGARVNAVTRAAVGTPYESAARHLIYETAPGAHVSVAEGAVQSDRPIVHSTSTPMPADVPSKKVHHLTTEQVQTAIDGLLAEEKAQTRDGIAAAVARRHDTTEAKPAHPLAETIAQLREAHVAISGWQGPVDIDLDAYGISNDVAAAAMTQLGLAYAAALRVLDPDNDDDLDLPDGDEVDACPTCSATPPDGANFCPGCGMSLTEDDGAAESNHKENAMTETTTADEADVQAAARRALGVPAEEKAPEVAVEKAPEAPAVEAAPVVEDVAPAPVATDAVPVTAPAAAPTVPQMNSADHEAIAALLASKLTTPPAETAAKTDGINETVAKAVAEATDAMRSQIVAAYGTPRRAGLIEAAEKSTEVDANALAKMSPTELTRYAANLWDGVLGAPGTV